MEDPLISTLRISGDEFTEETCELISQLLEARDMIKPDAREVLMSDSMEKH